MAVTKSGYYTLCMDTKGNGPISLSYLLENRGNRAMIPIELLSIKGRKAIPQWEAIPLTLFSQSIILGDYGWYIVSMNINCKSNLKLIIEKR